MARSTIIAALTLIAAAPLAAGPRDVPPGPSPSDGAATRYCLRVDPLTGSRIERTFCWTRMEWQEQGVDVDKEWPKDGVAVLR